MSNISSIHSVVAYKSGVTKPLEGQRLAKVTYKIDKASGIKPDSKAVSIPVIGWNEIEPFLASLKGEFVNVIQTAQDKIVRGLIEAGQTSISEEDIAMSSVVSYLLDSTGRLTGEAIRSWFDESLKEPLMLAFAPKLGIVETATPTAEQEARLNKVIKGYEDSFAKLASGAASFNQMQKENMIKALELVEDETVPLKDKFVARLSKVIDDDAMLLAL